MFASNLKVMAINIDETLKKTIQTIDKNGKGICFVINKKKLVGVITDGDIRRGLIKGFTIDSKVSEIINREYVYLKFGTPDSIIQQKLSNEIKYIPLVDSEGNLVDYASRKKYHNIPMASPALDGNELSYVTDCIETNWISSQGKYVSKFERGFADYICSANAITTSNGTTALHLALEALGIEEGDEVIVPNFTFIAPVNAILYTKATPVLVDIDPDSLCIDTSLIQKSITKKTKAILTVHIYGQSSSLNEISRIAKKHNLLVIEDCAEALGTYYNGKHVGIDSDASTFSFFGNKTLTTGEGGMVIFKNKAHEEKARMLRDHAMRPKKRYWHEKIGFNYRMTNLQAAIGLAQLERLDLFLEQKRSIAKKYDKNFISQSFFKVPKRLKNINHSFWLYTILLNEPYRKKRDFLIKKLLKNGIETRPSFYPVNIMKPYKKLKYYSSKIDNTKISSSAGISLPSFPGLDNDQINFISYTLIKEIENL